jgi:malonyl-CoA/methylmalonyl-CoA synthetase
MTNTGRRSDHRIGGSSRREPAGRLLPEHDPGSTALRIAGQSLTYEQLAASAGAVASAIGGARRAAVWATADTGCAIAIVGALTAGVPAVPVNPGAGPREVAHIVADARPDVVVAAPGAELPDALAALERVDAGHLSGSASWWPEPPPQQPALIVYTSGTTGLPKGAVLPRRALAADIDALAAAWCWTPDDVLTHALPLFHVHGLVLGLLGALRVGSRLEHPGRFTPDAIAGALHGGATMVFGVPTMYHRLAGAAGTDATVASALAGARLLVSGSAPLAAPDRRLIAERCGRRVVERYGMTETLITCATRADDTGAAGTVGQPVDGVDLRLVDDDGAVMASTGPDAVGEIEVRGPTLFLGYLDRPDATAAAVGPGGWFRTGDAAIVDDEGRIRIMGRRSSDIIKSGGHKIGAAEIEGVLLELPGVAEVAVTGEPDDDLGERVVAWIVPDAAGAPSAQVCTEHVAEQLASHKRPRVVRFVDRLPRNDMGKVLKHQLGS